jgi:hypothetical protein
VSRGRPGGGRARRAARTAPLAAPLVALAVALALAGGVRAAGDDVARSRAAFADVYSVLLSPRCRNCHPRGDMPLQGDRGALHAQNVSRRSEKNGLPCSTCHRARNGAAPHSPPGRPVWHLPPADHPMVFEGRRARELCLQLKDRKQNGGKTLDQLIAHVSGDALVLWAWDPGPGRTRPPLTHAEFTASFRAWVETGAHCPE